MYITEQNSQENKSLTGKEALKQLLKVLNFQGNEIQIMSEFYLHPSEWLIEKTQEVAYVGKDVEQGEQFFIYDVSG